MGAPQTCSTLPQPSLMSSGHAVVALLWGGCSMIAYVHSDGWPVGLDRGRAAGSLVAPPLKPTPATRQRLFWFLACMGRWGLVPCKACTATTVARRYSWFCMSLLSLCAVHGMLCLGQGRESDVAAAICKRTGFPKAALSPDEVGCPCSHTHRLQQPMAPWWLCRLVLGCCMCARAGRLWARTAREPLRFGQPARRVEFKASFLTGACAAAPGLLC